MSPASLERREWLVAGASARGSTHRREGIPNQDALAIWSAPEGGAPRVVVAVADGHGGARHFRSATGAELAAQTAVTVLRELAPPGEGMTADTWTRLAEVELPERLVSAWLSRVRSHLAAQPIVENEWSALDAAEGRAAVDSVRSNPVLAYGSTLLAAAASPDVVLVLQLGDGDIVAVAPDGTATRPLQRDERLTGNRTTSLCQPDAAGAFRTAALLADRIAISVLLLSTDGYAASFRTDADFLKVGPDFLAMIERDGLGTVSALIEGILDDASENGSGDDITLGMLHRGGKVLPAEHQNAASDLASQETPQVASQEALDDIWDG